MVYAHLITGNQETAKELLPLKTKSKKKRLSEDARVNIARRKSENAACDYVNNPSELNLETLQNCKENLLHVYNQVEEEELNKMIEEVELTFANAKHRES